MSSALKIIHHNTEGLECHMDDLKCHHELLLADVCVSPKHTCQAQLFLHTSNWMGIPCTNATDMYPTQTTSIWQIRMVVALPFM